MQYFPNIEPVRYEGPNSDSPSLSATTTPTN